MYISNKPTDLVFLDIETTGLNPDSDEVIEVALIRTKDLEIVDTYHSLVKPYRQIPKFITNLTGISKNEVDKSPRIDEIRPNVENFILDYPILAHNASFDKLFLEKILEKEIPNEFFDTLEISRLFMPELQSHSLESLVKTLNLEKHNHHRALSDTYMLIDLFKRILSEKNKFSKKILANLKEITKDAINLEVIFGESWHETGTEEEKDIFSFNENINRLNLPFREHAMQNSIFNEKTIFVEVDSYEQALREAIKLLDSSKIAISIYSETNRKPIRDFFEKEKYTVEVYENPERFICPKKIKFFMENFNMLPKDYRVNFATIITYLYKTGDLFIDYAPVHILKNPVLRLLSFCDDEENCEFSQHCPLKEKVKLIKDADVVLTEHQFVVSDESLKDVIKSRSIIFLEAYRLPKVFYSSRFGLSKQDLDLLSKYEKIENNKLTQVLSLFDKYPENNTSEFIEEDVRKIGDTFSEHKNPIISKLLGKESFLINKRNGALTILGVNKNPQHFSAYINGLSNISVFVSMHNSIQGVNLLKEFTGVHESKTLSLRRITFENALSVVPLYMHSPNHSEFTEEMVNMLLKFYNTKSAVIFNSSNLLKEVYYSLKSRLVDENNKYPTDLLSNIDFMYYDNLIFSEYSEIYLIKSPIIKSEGDNSEFSELLSLYTLKNIVTEFLNNNKTAVVFYLDGRFKNKDFRNKYEDIFLSFPILIEREEVLHKLIESHRKRNI